MKKQFIVIGIAAFAFLSGCQNSSSLSPKSEDVLSVSLKRLAEMHSDQSVDQSLYDAIWARTQALTPEEYEIYLRYWIEDSVQDSIDLKLITEDQRKSEIQKAYDQRRIFDQAAQLKYGKRMYQLSLKEQFEIADNLPTPQANANARITSCPTYSFPFVVNDDGSGTNNNVGVFAAGNPGTVDCDWEIAYNIGNVVPKGKAKTLSARARSIFLLGGINFRRPSAPQNVAHRRLLVGKNRIAALYGSTSISAASTFASEVRFHG